MPVAPPFVSIELLERRTFLAAVATPDLTYGTGGVVDIGTIGGSTLHVGMIEAAVGGAVYVATPGAEGPEGEWKLLRLDSAGAPDETFGGGDGRVSLVSDVPLRNVTDLHALPDGGVIITGTIEIGGQVDLAVIRLRGDGTPDPMFGGGDGIVSVQPRGMSLESIDDLLACSDLAADGSIVLVTRQHTAELIDGIDVVMLRPDGSLDSRFDGDGIFTITSARELEGLMTGFEWKAVFFAPDGGHVDVIEVARNEGNSIREHYDAISVRRLPRSGAIDARHIPEGVVQSFYSLPSSLSFGAAARLPDGGMLVGYENAAVGRVFRLNPDLTADASFNGFGTGRLFPVPAPAGRTSGPQAITVLPDSRFYVAGGAVLQRYLADGSPDPLFAPIVLGDGNANGVSIALAAESALILTRGPAPAPSENTTYEDRLRKIHGDRGIHLTNKGTLVLAGSALGERIGAYRRADGRWVAQIGEIRRSFAADAVKRILAAGYGGDDLVYTKVERGLIAYGGDGNDLLYGHNRADLLAGDRGDDLLMAYGGDDALYGGDGRDALFGHGGNDRLFGGATPHDQLDGGDGTDIGREIDGIASAIELLD